MKMKPLFIALLFFTSANLFAQTEKKYYLGTHLSYGKASYSKSVFDFSSSKEYSGKDFFTFALDYSHRVSPATDFCIGLSASVYRLNMDSRTGHMSGGYNSASYNDAFAVFSLPITLKYHFGRYFFINAGPCFNYHRHHGYTWGLGALGGIGAEYTYKSGLTLSFAPHIQYNLLSVGGTGNSYGMSSGMEETLSQIGVNLGIGYRFWIYCIHLEKAYNLSDVDAPSYMIINCFWVSGKYKGNGHAKALLLSAIDDAKAKGQKGLVTVVGTKKFHFMSDTKWLLGQEFETVEKLPNGFSLLIFSAFYNDKFLTTDMSIWVESGFTKLLKHIKSQK